MVFQYTRQPMVEVDVEMASASSSNFVASQAAQGRAPVSELYLIENDPRVSVPPNVRVARVVVNAESVQKRTLEEGEEPELGPMDRVQEELQTRVRVVPLRMFECAGEDGSRPLPAVTCEFCKHTSTDKWLQCRAYARDEEARRERVRSWARFAGRLTGGAVGGKWGPAKKENARRVRHKWAWLAEHALARRRVPWRAPLNRALGTIRLSMVRFAGVDGIPRHLCSVCLGVLTNMRQDPSCPVDREIMGAVLHWLNINSIDMIILNDMTWAHFAHRHRGRPLTAKSGRFKGPPITMGAMGERRFYDEWVNPGDVVAAYVHGPHLVVEETMEIRPLEYFNALLCDMLPDATPSTLHSMVLRFFEDDLDHTEMELSVLETGRRRSVIEELMKENVRRLIRKAGNRERAVLWEVEEEQRRFEEEARRATEPLFPPPALGETACA